MIIDDIRKAQGMIERLFYQNYDQEKITLTKDQFEELNQLLTNVEARLRSHNKSIAMLKQYVASMPDE